MENIIKIGEAGKTLGQHYVDAVEALETQETPEVNEAVEETPKSNKWYEQEGAFPYTEGDTVIIVNNKHKGLIGRLAKVVKPSAKKDATKAHLIKPDGTLQKTLVTLDFSGIELFKEEEVTQGEDQTA